MIYEELKIPDDPGHSPLTPEEQLNVLRLHSHVEYWKHGFFSVEAMRYRLNAYYLEEEIEERRAASLSEEDRAETPSPAPKPSSV